MGNDNSSTSVHGVVRRPRLLKIEPQPIWEETPMLSDDGYWCGRYRTCHHLGDGYGEIGIEVDAVKPPNNEVIPVEQDGVWYWENHFPDAGE